MNVADETRRDLLKTVARELCGRAGYHRDTQFHISQPALHAYLTIDFETGTLIMRLPI